MNYEDQKIIDVEIQQEMKKAYIEYAMSVIVGRALPDVRDGLKPVHRRILYCMYEDGLSFDKKFRKSATTVGDVLGRYHPHGDASVYDALVRMAQPFSLRYPLIDGHGNFGSVDGDPAAAYRYTEARMSKISNEMLADIEKETVDFSPNFDEMRKEPTVLPARFPTLLVNGSMGIAVGMATNIPPHNLSEVIDAVVELIDNPEATLEDLMRHVKGPDFPTGGTIMGRSGIRQAYETGHGRVMLRAKCEIVEHKEGRFRIIVTEIPYMVNKARMIENIAEHIHDKRIEGIVDIVDQSSDRTGMKVVIDLKRDANPQVVLNQLYKHSSLQESVSIHMLSLVKGEPKVLSLREMLDHFIAFQKEIIERRTRYDLKKARERAHILEGLRIAVDNIDEVIRIIRGSYNDAKPRLMERFNLSDIQAQAILDMRLARLQGLELEKIIAEYEEIQRLILELEGILESPEKVSQIVRDEILDIKKKYGDARMTDIEDSFDDIDIEDLIEEENCVFTLTNQGYLKRQSVSTYHAQKRGGRGISGMSTKEEDFVETLFIGSTHSYILFFTSKGRMFKKKGYEVPESSRAAKGTNIINLLEIEQGEKISAMIEVKNFDEGTYLTMLTKFGTVKRTPLPEFSSNRRSGIIAISLDEGDELIRVKEAGPDDEIIVATHHGKAIRFKVSDVRPMGRTARGVRAILMSKDDYVVGMSTARDDLDLLTVTENGYGKRTSLAEYKTQTRGGKGVLNYHITDKTGNVAGVKSVTDEDDILMITSNGIIIRYAASDVSRFSRVTQGVIVMRMTGGESVVNLARTVKEDEDDVVSSEEEALADGALEGGAETGVEGAEVSEAQGEQPS